MTMIKPFNLLMVWHGLFAGSYLVSYATAEFSLGMHLFAGYALLALLFLRLAVALFVAETSPWSLPWPNARLARTFSERLRAFDLAALRGRNPLVILSGLALIVASLLAALSGFLPWEDPHEALASFSLATVGVHVAAVLLTQFIKRWTVQAVRMPA
ncbi:MAG: cytochrome b/b6 domain-containing protein [Rhodospirillales bacterium]|nr:cytochrome b/b6 domain-containing protein [Rhodospirillales bacterium]